LTFISAWHAIAGFSLSATVTVNVQLSLFPDASVAMDLTLVVPLLKVEPDGGAVTTVPPGQLSVT